MPPVWYVYPMWHRVSFTLVARKHLEQLKKRMRIHEIDELAFPHVSPHTRPVVLIHPYFYCMLRAAKFISRKLHRYGALIGIDVADSDHLSNLAVSMSYYARRMIVPSTFCKRVFERSGVTVPVDVVPHGLDMEWYEKPKQIGKFFPELAKIKERKRIKFVLFFLWHSGYRKGDDLVIEWYKRLWKERKDVAIILKTGVKEAVQAQILRPFNCVHIFGWLTEEQKMELFDLADIYPLFSRGGAFEINGLEAIARLVPVLAAKGGAWEDYLPSWSLVDSHRCKCVLPNNPLHDGGGVEIEVEKAVDRAHIILDNLDDYRERLREHIEKRVKHVFNWEAVGERLYKIIVEVIEEVSR